MTQLQGKELFTLDELQERYGVSRSWLYKRCADKSLPHYKLGKRTLVDLEEFERFLMDHSRVDAIGRR